MLPMKLLWILTFIPLSLLAWWFFPVAYGGYIHSPSPSPISEVSPSPSLIPCDCINPFPSEEAVPSATPEEPHPGLTNPGPGGTSGSDGKPTYDANNPSRGGVLPSGPPATGFGKR